MAVTAKSLTREELEETVLEVYSDGAPEVMTVIERWIDRGDGAAIYRNEDLGHPDLGQVQIVSFGSPAAQLETDEPPTTLPDIGNQINWRYQLKATFREEIPKTPIRQALVRGAADDLERIQAYLPRNYSARTLDDDVLISGRDNAGWTLDAYVIPRLASGLIVAEEVADRAAQEGS